MADKSGLYIVLIVGIVAMVALIIIVSGEHRTETPKDIDKTEDTTGQATISDPWMECYKKCAAGGGIAQSYNPCNCIYLA